MEFPEKIEATFVPPPVYDPPPAKIVIRAPADKRGNPQFPTLHLTIEQAVELDDAICAALAEYEDYHEERRGGA